MVCVSVLPSITSLARASPSGAASSPSPTACRRGIASRPTRTRSPAMRRSARKPHIVPIVEPEVLMDGDHSTHTIDRCYEVTEWTLRTVFRELYDARVKLEGIVLKPNMVIAGQKCRQQASAAEVAEKTLKLPQDHGALDGAGHRVPLGRAVGRSRHRASVADERIRSVAVGANVLVRPRAAGRGAQSLGWKIRERRRRSARLRASREDEWPGCTGQVGCKARKGGVTVAGGQARRVEDTPSA